MKSLLLKRAGWLVGLFLNVCILSPLVWSAPLSRPLTPDDRLQVTTLTSKTGALIAVDPSMRGERLVIEGTVRRGGASTLNGHMDLIIHRPDGSTQEQQIPLTISGGRFFKHREFEWMAAETLPPGTQIVLCFHNAIESAHAPGDGCANND